MRGRCKNDLVAEKRRYAAAAQRKAQRAAHAGWRGDALQEIGLKEDGKMRRQVERRAAAQAKNRKASRKKAGNFDTYGGLPSIGRERHSCNFE